MRMMFLVNVELLFLPYWCILPCGSAYLSVPQVAHRYWKVMEFKIHIFQAWEVMKLGLGPGKSWKVMENELKGCHISDPCTCFRPLHTSSLSTVRHSSICWTCSISTRLNSPGKTWKTHIKRSWKVMETTFSVLYAPWYTLCALNLLLAGKR